MSGFNSNNVLMHYLCMLGVRFYKWVVYCCDKLASLCRLIELRIELYWMCKRNVPYSLFLFLPEFAKIINY